MDPAQRDTAYSTFVSYGGRLDRAAFDRVLPVFLYYIVQIAYDGVSVPETIRIEAEMRGLSVRLVAFEFWHRFIEQVGYRRYDGDLIMAAVDQVLKFTKPSWL
jgi:hypothetical protein